MGTKAPSTPQGAERIPSLHGPQQPPGLTARARDPALCRYHDDHMSMCVCVCVHVLTGYTALQKPVPQTGQTTPHAKSVQTIEYHYSSLSAVCKNKRDSTEDSQTNSTMSSDHSSATRPHQLNRSVSSGTALVVQWVRTCAPNAGGLRSIPGCATRSCMQQLRCPRAVKILRAPGKIQCHAVLRSAMSDSATARLLCSWGFSRQEYWSGLPCPPLGDLPNPRTESRSPSAAKINK